MERRFHESGNRMRMRALERLQALIPGVDFDRAVNDPAGCIGTHSSSGADTTAVDLLNSEIDHLLTRHDTEVQLLAMQRSEPVEYPSLFSDRGMSDGGQRIRPGTLASALLRDELTVRIAGIDAQFATLDRICSQFDTLFGLRSSTNLYITAGATPGTVAHYDHHDVYLLQVRGSKGWDIAPVDPLPPAGEAGTVDMHTSAWSGTLSKGETLYLPRGWAHMARPDGSLSIHTTIAVRRPTWSTIFTDAWRFLGAEPPLTADLPAVPWLQADLLAPARDRFADAAGAGNFELIVTHVLALLQALVPPRTFATFDEVVAATRSPLSKRYRWASPTEPLITAEPEPRMAFGGCVLSGSGAEHLALLGMVGEETWSPESALADGVPESELRSLILQLVDRGLLDPVPDEQHAGAPAADPWWQTAP